MFRPIPFACLAPLAILSGCSSSNQSSGADGGGSLQGMEAGGSALESSTADGAARDPDTAPVVSVDRFSDAFAHLFKRSANAAFPAANAPIACVKGA